MPLTPRLRMSYSSGTPAILCGQKLSLGVIGMSVQSEKKSKIFRSMVGGTLICAISIIAGCKGSSSFSAPSWSMFGGSNSADAAKLTAAPPFKNKLEKPSESATPYPTTTTPSSYAVTDSVKSSATGQPTVSTSAVAAIGVEQTSVTYGSTPVPPKQSPADTNGPTGSAIAPQVGPYAALPQESPSAEDKFPPMQAAVPAPAFPGSRSAVRLENSSPSTTPLNSFGGASGAGEKAGGAFPATAGYEPVPNRVADSRGAASFTQTPSVSGAADPAPESVPSNSRYSSAGSRFADGQSNPIAPQNSAAFPAVNPATPVLQTPVAPTEAIPAAQGIAPPVFSPVAPPVRRPDPGYRPGGTSSYRPSRAILVDDSQASPSAVRTAGYQVPVPNTVRE